MEEKRKEVGYNQEANPKKYFCVNCIPLVEKSYRDKERFRIFRYRCRNQHANPSLQGKRKEMADMIVKVLVLLVQNTTFTISTKTKDVKLVKNP